MLQAGRLRVLQSQDELGTNTKSQKVPVNKESARFVLETSRETQFLWNWIALCSEREKAQERDQDSRVCFVSAELEIKIIRYSDPSC